MTNQISALKKLSTQLNETYRQLLDINAPAKMPMAQLAYFIDQAMDRHYLVEIEIKNFETTMIGYLSKGPKGSLLVQRPGQSVTGFVQLKQIQYLKRV